MRIGFIRVRKFLMDAFPKLYYITVGPFEIYVAKKKAELYIFATEKNALNLSNTPMRIYTNQSNSQIKIPRGP